MRRYRIPVGTVAGIRLWVHVSWFPVLGLVAWVTTVQFGEVYPGMGAAERTAMGAITGIAFFACLTAHEVSHSLVARRFGITVNGITLFLFGGVAEIEGEVPTPTREFAVALAGPATSIAIAGVAALLASAASALGWAGAEGVLVTLAVVNLGVGVFNLLPGLPLDGGRILRAGLWRATGSFERATRVAAAGGRVLAALVVALGVAVAIAGDAIGLWYVTMGGFLWLMAHAASAARTPGTTAALPMPRDPELAGEAVAGWPAAHGNSAGGARR
jgi:Zn-dependent protease